MMILSKKPNPYEVMAKMPEMVFPQAKETHEATGRRGDYCSKGGWDRRHQAAVDKIYWENKTGGTCSSQKEFQEFKDWVN